MKHVVSSGRWLRALLVLTTAMTLLAGSTGLALADSGLDGGSTTPGAVYAMSNASDGNAVLVFTRAANGSLAADGSFLTGGNGNGGSLHSQGALVLNSDGRFLLGVNAGSNQVFSFAVTPHGLQIKSTVASGGALPTSVTVHNSLVYALNHDSSTVSGFRLSDHGTLSAIAGSTHALSMSGTDPAEVSFDPSGRFLLVTERVTSFIDVFTVNQSTGRVTGPATYPADGSTPYGFAFGMRGQLVVSEAGSTAVSSYGLSGNGTVTAISGPLASGGGAPCWIMVTNNGKLAYVANAGASNIGRFSLAPNGTLSMLGVTNMVGTTPVEMTLSNNSQFLYVLETGSNTIGGFAIHADGSLTAVPGASLPANAAGLAAR